MSGIIEEGIGFDGWDELALYGYKNQISEAAGETDEKMQELMKNVLAQRNEEVYKSLGQKKESGLLAMMKSCSIEVNIDVTISVENSGNGSGNVGSSDNGYSSENSKENPKEISESSQGHAKDFSEINKTGG
jgi:hypothetical protein